MKLERNQRKKHHWLIKALIAAGAIIGTGIYRMPPKQRKKDSEKIVEAVKRFSSLFVDYCVPHERNNYRPKALHHRSVHTMILFVVLVKIGILSVLFTLYPNLAHLDQNIQSMSYTLINQYRTEKGTVPLLVNSYLEEAALQKGQDMLEQNYFSHFGPDGKKPWQWLDPSQYTFKAMGENLAMDFLSANSVVKAFQKSPSHDRNLLNTAYSEVGIAVLNGYLDGHNTNLMVVFFASPKAEAPIAQAPAPVPQPVAENKPVVPQPQPKPISTEPPPAEKPVAILPVPTTTVAQTPVVGTVRQVSSAVAAAEVLGESTGADQLVVADNLKGGSVFSQGNMTQRILAWSDRFFYAFLIAAILLLLVNIFVKIRVQHVPSIANGSLLIAVLVIALFWRVHQAEAIGEQVRVLAQWFIPPSFY
ncbi:MAG: hypothetical protein HY422_00940 [Candidatus Komeilibacteria bacterium]|nr:hypothetical protein [Candidatus Komeilibacteria bacterium]